MNLSENTKATILEWMKLYPERQALIDMHGPNKAVDLYLQGKSRTWLQFAIRGMQLYIWRRKKRRNYNAQN